jgi:hypothetical protein
LSDISHIVTGSGGLVQGLGQRREMPVVQKVFRAVFFHDRCVLQLSYSEKGANDEIDSLLG